MNITSKSSPSKTLCRDLINWYSSNHRDLPWRKDRDPYRIWISEVMLQQTTVATVIPYFEKFMAKFPTVKRLAEAPLEQVFEAWAGLGYYSRARNLHKAAQLVAKNGFPQTASELIELPGFGPYTSRAVASQAFSEPVGVLDGNVIRVLSRVYGKAVNWWNNQARIELQLLADEMAQYGPPNEVNQGLMELGATVCTPRSPTCVLCPWKRRCVALHEDRVDKLPNKKPRRKSEVWVWDVELIELKISNLKDSKFAYIENNYVPFLKGTWIFPGKIQRQNKKPKSFALRHGITHHDIYIRIHHRLSAQAKAKIGASKSQWYSSHEVKKINPSSALQKILQAHVKS
jgi:A/G-specific adenine glycosylase